MRNTLFAGLTQLDPADPLSTDDYSFQAINPDIIDRLLEVGAVTHRHDGHAALENPTLGPSVSVIASGGQIPGGVTFEFAYTQLDADRGETAASPIGSVTTPDLMAAPAFAPVGSADYSAGSLAADAYYYVHTWVDAGGGETTMGPIEPVDVNPYPNAQVLLSGLASAMPGGAVGWRLYRARGGENFHYLASGTGDTITDDGNLCAQCQVFPPEINTTTQSRRWWSTSRRCPLALSATGCTGDRCRAAGRSTPTWRRARARGRTRSRRSGRPTASRRRVRWRSAARPDRPGHRPARLALEAAGRELGDLPPGRSGTCGS